MDVASRKKGSDPVSSHEEDRDDGEFEGSPSRDDEEEDGDYQPSENARFKPKQPESYSLNVRMSESLYKRLVQVARDEGVSADDFACELLAEGVVLRAWEIVEKKSAMRGSNMGNQPQGNQQRHGHKGPGQGGGGGGGGPRRPHNKGRGSYANSMNLLEDKAAFLEYVRNQEKRNR